ncbi:protein tipD, putative [Entamoeba invadens IP1]|uniref:Protein tipD, putative n=1 Tax=Entamoeba invadens IP1 TaxID=370355 RepID=A0A0A1U2Y1_ENTIV|nr:protein tipD, putative [Entamoeba invadens IP1]ELP88384.1 protein tipD, putative [Entamoeba invadens IP1]|eukprot:XP_004255155.1 protein tipD, putative [Entamoeba invadens IP1]
MDVSVIHGIFLSKLDKRDRVCKDPFKSVTKCCGGGDSANTKELLEEVDNLKKENFKYARDFYQATTKFNNSVEEKKKLETDLADKDKQIKDKDDEVKLLQTKNEEIQKEVAQKIETINVIRQESAAHQVNRVKIEDDLKRLNIENHRVMDEYAKLEQELRVTKELCAKAQTTVLQHSQSTSALPQEVNKSQSSQSLDVSPSQLPEEGKRQIVGHSSDILCLKYNLNGTVLASASADKTVKLWDVVSGKIKSSFGGVLQSFTDLAFSPMGDMLLATSNDGTAKIWFLASSRLRHSLTGHNGKVTCGDFYDTDKVMTGSSDRTLKTWDVNKGYCLKTTVCYSSCNCLMMGGMGNLMATGHCDNTIRFWDVRSKECVDINRNFHTGSVSDIVNVRDGRYFVTVGKDNIVNYIDGTNRQIVSTFSHSDFSVTSTTRICCSNDGKFIVAGSANGDIFCWNTETKKLENVLKPKLTQPTRAGCYAVAWNPVQSQLVSGHGNKIVVWEF